MKARKIGVGSAVCAMLLLPQAPLAAQSLSWGKPGASRQDYDAGGVECSLRAAQADVSDRKEVKEYVRGQKVLDRENNLPAAGTGDQIDQAQRQVFLRRMYAPDRKVDDLQKSLQSEVESCLTNAGYVRYALTKSQDKALRKLAPGSEARKAYLYSLGSDAAVVEKQRVAPAS